MTLLGRIAPLLGFCRRPIRCPIRGHRPLLNCPRLVLGRSFLPDPRPRVVAGCHLLPFRRVVAVWHLSPVTWVVTGWHLSRVAWVVAGGHWCSLTGVVAGGRGSRGPRGLVARGVR